MLTLATAIGGIPYCAHVFYAYDAVRNRLIFTSDAATRHGAELAENPTVAAAIAWETKLVGRVEGAQITGRVTAADKEDAACYMRRFPYTLLVDLTLWAIEPNMIKHTDNKLGFGTKLIWKIE